MNKLRFISVGLISLGLLLIMAGGGFLYTDFANREGAWAELQFTSRPLTDEEHEAIHLRWHNRELGYWAFGLGAIGVGSTCFGSLSLLFLRAKPLVRDAVEL